MRDSPCFWQSQALGEVARPARRRVQAEGGVGRSRAHAGRPPQGRAALRADGQRGRSRRQQACQTRPAHRPQRQRGERRVRGDGEGPHLRQDKL
jgi:hypothetical protein